MADALDALAPAAAPSAPAPAAPSPAAPAPSYASPPSAAAPALAAPAAAPASAPEPGLTMAQLARELGYDSVDEYKADLAFARRARGEHERRQSQERQNDPQYQQTRARGEALRTLMAEGYSPEVADALPSLPEISQFLADQRAEGAQRVMVEALGEIGIRDDGSKDAQEIIAEIEDRLTFRLNQPTREGLRLNRLYHGTPAERRACVQELVQGEERYLNRHLLRQNAATMRDHATRAGAQPRGGRGVSASPQVRQEKPTATDPTARRREGNAIAGRQLDDIWAHHN